MNHVKKSKNLIKTTSLGPIQNLEEYVTSDWWRHIFNANYLRTDGDVCEDPEITKNETDLFTAILNLSKEALILDLCCGQGRHTLEFAKRGYSNITGLDRSRYLIRRAKKTNQLAGLNVKFKEGDARNLPFPNHYFDAIIMLGNSFGYFESSMDDRYVLEEIKRTLKTNGKLLLDITNGIYLRKNFAPRSWEWIDKNYFVCRERSLSKDHHRLISREVISHVNKGVIADQFYAERLYSFDEIHALLTEIGFSDIREHSLITESKRNQDLGMMAERMILIADAQKQHISIPKIDPKNIIVLMGDPNKHDIVKPNATFDDDDFYTINALKESLAKLKQYNFIYLDKHDTFVQDLKKYRETCHFVLNLCDEGFNNEPHKELHVPALLEMLNIPYSGSNPQCLAYCYDKSLVRAVAKEIGVPVPQALIITNPEELNFIDFSLEFPVIVKPNFGDSSFGITAESVCHDIASLDNAIKKIKKVFGYNNTILIEEFLIGKEIGVGIIGNPAIAYIVLPMIEEDYSSLPANYPQICSYESKWDPNSPYWKITSIAADLSEEIKEFLAQSCLKLFERLDCRDYVRFDWRLDAKGMPRLLEVNPNPGWCWDGHLAKMAKLQNTTYGEMLNMILTACEKRISHQLPPRLCLNTRLEKFVE